MPARVPSQKKKGVQGILGRDHYDAIDVALRKLGDLPAAIEAAELCDVDCQEARQAHKYLVEKLGKIKQHFFPQGRPSS